MKFIVDKNGQWKNPGKNTFIPNANGRITMKGVGYPLLGIDDKGNSAVMQPGGEYQFPGNGVYEIPLTEDEAMAYAANGYIVEELGHGGPHDPPSYEDAMQAYKDSIAAKEAYEEEYKKKEKDYSKLKAKYDRYNKVYLNNKKMWELIDSIDPESNPYVDIDNFPSFNQGPNAYKLYQNLPSDIKEQLGFPEFDKRDIGQRFNTSVNPPGSNNNYFDEDAGSAELIDLYHLHSNDLAFRYPKDDPKYKPNHAHLAYPTVTNWNHRFYPQDHAKGLYVEENFPIASVYDVHSDSFKNITDKDVKIIDFFGDRHSDLDHYNREILKLLKESGLDLTGMTTNSSQSEDQILDRLIKLQEPDKIGSLEYNPPEVLERPSFADYVDPMPVIKPELIVDASLPEELEEGENFNNDYKAKRVVDKIKMPKINKRGKIRRGPFGTKTTRSVRYEPVEEQQIYPEGFVPRFAPGGAYGPGDGIKKFLRKNNIKGSFGFGNTAPHLNNYVPKIGFNTIMGKPRKGFLDLGLTAGGDKKGFAGNLDATYYGPFMGGNRHFQALIDSDTYYDQGTVGSSVSGGGNWIGGSRNIGNKRKDGLRKGDWSTEGGIGLQIGAFKDLNAPPIPYYQQDTSGGAPLLKYKPSTVGIDFGPKAHFRFQKAFGNNLTLDAKASIVADLVKNSQEGAAEGDQANYVYEYIDNPDAPNYTNANQTIQGNSILSNTATEERFRPEFKPSAEVKLTYNIPTNGSLFGRKRSVPDLVEEDIEPVNEIPAIEEKTVEEKPKERKLKKPKKVKPAEPKTMVRHPRWLKDGGFIEIDLSKDELKAYANNGYIVEEMHRGGSAHKHPHDNLTHAQRKQAYDDSLTLYDYSKDLLKYRDKAEAFPEVTEEMVNKPWLYDKVLKDRQLGVMRDFMMAANPKVQEAIGGPQYQEAINRLTLLNQEDPGYKGNWVNIPGGGDTYISQNFTTYDKPKSPPRLPTMKEAYKNVDKDKYPTFEDFEFAAEYYKENGENPTEDMLPSFKPDKEELKEEEVKEVIEDLSLDKLPIIKPGLLKTNSTLPEELEEGEEAEGIDYERKFGVWTEQGKTKRAKLRNLFGYYIPEFFNDKPSRSIKYKTGKKLKAGFYNKSIEAELNDKEVEQYIAGGYVLEELPKAQDGGDDEIKRAIEFKKNLAAYTEKDRNRLNANTRLLLELDRLKSSVESNKPQIKSLKEMLDKPSLLQFDLRPEDVKEAERLQKKKISDEFEQQYAKVKEREEQEKLKQLREIGKGLSNADWKGLGNALLDKASSSLEPLASPFYQSASMLKDFYQNKVKELELSKQEVKDLEDKGYVVEEILPEEASGMSSPAEQRINSGMPIGSYSPNVVEDTELLKSWPKIKDDNTTFENWYLDKVSKNQELEARENNKTFVPIMANHPANAFRNQTDNGGILYDGPITPAEKFGEAVGEYADAAAGLPKKIYEGVSNELADLKDKFDKTSILPSNITEGVETIKKPFDYIDKFGVKDGIKEYLTDLNSKNPIVNNPEQDRLILKNEKLNEDLQALTYKLGDPDVSAEDKLKYQKEFDELVNQKQLNVDKVNQIRAGQVGPFDTWFNATLPILLNDNTLLKFTGDILGKDFSQAGTDLKQIANKVGAVDKLELSESINPKFETYAQKLERETDHYLEDKRFDDLDVSKKDWYRWRFRASASNNDPFMLSLYGTRGERSTNSPNLLGQGALFHFLDQSPLTGYQHRKTRNFIKKLKPNDYIGVLEKSPDAGNVYALKYKQKKDHNVNSKNSFYIRTNKFDNINFSGRIKDDNFPGHNYWTLKSNGKPAVPISIAPDPNLYDYNSGQSVVFIFKYTPKSGKVQQRYIHFAGSPNEIKKEGFKIKNEYGLKYNELILGVADAGSYSASVRSKSGKVTNKLLNTTNSGYFNPNSFTGAGAVLLNPKLGTGE